MRKKFKTILILMLSCMAIIPVTQAQSQNFSPCAFDEYTNNKSLLKTERIIQHAVELRRSADFNEVNNNEIRTIPVVVHVLHNEGSENITDEQIQSQIDILNQDYRKTEGSNGDGNGVDTRVEFCLAKIDPYGNCTNGIVRIKTALTNHQTYERALLKQLSFWDNTRYLNIYIVKTIAGGILGYSSFPGGPPDEDGMVVRHSVFGNMGTASSSLGRTTSHEIGHWFGLYHTFNNGCGDDVCLDGDYVCDTPPQASPSFSCGTFNTCSNDEPDLNDQKENYMNYTPDACKNMFTEGQKLRMQATLDSIRTLIWSEQNLIATGCDSNYVAPEICGVTARFVMLTPDICHGSEVEFMDISLNDATSWEWTFPGGDPQSSADENPVVTYNEIGSYAVTLVVSNENSSDSITLPDYVSVSTPGIGNALPLIEGFESGVFPPQDIIINNFDGGVTWELDSAAAYSGNYSIKIDNLININYGSADEIVMPFLDLTSFGSTDLRMRFKWAYAKSDPSFSDEMIVLLSTDCGSNFNQIFYRTGSALATGPTQTTPFIPDSTQWKSANISLNNYSDEQYVQIKIVNITDGGNNLYIDNIEIGDMATGIENMDHSIRFKYYPNPASDYLNLEFPDGLHPRTVNLYSISGQLLRSENVGTQRVSSLSVAGLQPGIYYLEIVEENSRKTQKLIISR